MSLRLYDTRLGKKVPFEPLTPGQVGMYACGITVYDLCHVGHARMLVAWDVIARHLRASGLAVKYVRNVTDVDDKIIRKANAEGVSSAEIADRYTRLMHEDMQALGLAVADHEPRATEHIAEVIDIVRLLVEADRPREHLPTLFLALAIATFGVVNLAALVRELRRREPAR